MLKTLLSIKRDLLTTFATRPACLAANMDCIRVFLSFWISRAKSWVMYASLCLAEDLIRFLTLNTASLSSLTANLAIIGRGRAGVAPLLCGFVACPRGGRHENVYFERRDHRIPFRRRYSSRP